MAAEDELVLPQVPEARPDDPEDVSWALSTAEAMWARGDHSEGVKWVRKAAEAASDAENDMRALELAKAASELATMLTRRSLSDRGPTSSQKAPNTAPMGHPSGPPAPLPVSRPTPPPMAAPVSSAPPRPAPIPLPSKASQPPGSPGPGSPGSMRPAAGAPPPPPTSSSPGRLSAPPRPLAAGAPIAQGPQPGRGILSNRTAEPKKSRRRSRENLDSEARGASAFETAPQKVVTGPMAEHALDDTSEVTAAVEVPVAPRRRRQGSKPDGDATIIARREDIEAEQRKSAVEWDASPTQDLTSDEMDHMSPHTSPDGDRMTTAFAAPPPAAAVKAPSVRPPSLIHDPEIQTSQAVRVVVWRDATGVHVAPAGTVVSSITIDAVLVVLEPSADLTAWLSQRTR